VPWVLSTQLTLILERINTTTTRSGQRIAVWTPESLTVPDPFGWNCESRAKFSDSCTSPFKILQDPWHYPIVSSMLSGTYAGHVVRYLYLLGRLPNLPTNAPGATLDGTWHLEPNHGSCCAEMGLICRCAYTGSSSWGSLRCRRLFRTCNRTRRIERPYLL
jgi:hypothetical protein